MKSLGKERNGMLKRLEEALAVTESPDEKADLKSAINIVKDAIEFAEFWNYVDMHMGIHRVQSGTFTEYDILMLKALLEKYASNVSPGQLYRQ